VTSKGQCGDSVFLAARIPTIWEYTGIAWIQAQRSDVAAKGTPAEITALPPFDSTLLGLLDISHAGYLAGKLPDQK